MTRVTYRQILIEKEEIEKEIEKEKKRKRKEKKRKRKEKGHGMNTTFLTFFLNKVKKIKS